MSIYKPKKLNNDGSLEDIKIPLDSLDGSEDLNFAEIEVSDVVSETSTNVVTGKGVYNAIKNANHGYVLDITASTKLNDIPYFTIPKLTSSEVENLAKAYMEQKPAFIHYVPTEGIPYNTSHYYTVDSANYTTSASSSITAEVHIHVDIDLSLAVGKSLCLEILYQSSGTDVTVRSNPDIIYVTTRFFDEVNEELPDLGAASIAFIATDGIIGSNTKIMGYDDNGYVEVTDVISSGTYGENTWITFCWKNKIYKMTTGNGIKAELLDMGYLKPTTGIPKSDLADDVQETLNTVGNIKTELNNKQNALNESQLNAVNSSITSDLVQKISTNETNIQTINDKIPNQATITNQLADKDFVNSSLNSIAAFYITKNANGDSFSSKAELDSTTTFYSGGVTRTPTRNDYCIVLSDESKDNSTTRYIYNNGWEFQYIVNETALTSEQLKAINSGITKDLVATFKGKTTTTVSGVVTNLNFTSDPQTQINNINSKLPVISIESGYLCIRTN